MLNSYRQEIAGQSSFLIELKERADEKWNEPEDKNERGRGSLASYSV